MNREKKILQNTLFYTIGNFGSKVLSYIIVLLYTWYIGQEELGYYDLLITTLGLITPFLILSFDEGIYRWMIDDKKRDKKAILSTCLKAILVTTTISIFVILILNVKFHFKYLINFIGFIVLSVIYQLFMNAVRGLANSKLYALIGIIYSFIDLVLEIVCLIFLHMGVEALLFSKNIAMLICILIIYWVQSEFKGFIKSKFDFKLFREMILYSFPLIPNTVSWWIVNFSDRYIILAFLGTGANGIYAISNKFPTVITVITGIVYYALQETIIKEYDSADRDEFYSSIFKKYYILLFTLVICGIPASKMVIELFVEYEYRIAWHYISFLFISAVFNALSSFLGIGYQISRETKRSVVSTVLAAISNIVINTMFINRFGLHAAGFSTLFAYIFLFVIRIIHSKKYFDLKINWGEFIILTILCGAVGLLSYIANLIGLIGLELFGLLLLFVLNREFVLSIIATKKGVNEY